MILVIVSDKKIRDLIEKKVLKPLGFEVLIAADEKIGLELALLKNPQLILFDGKSNSVSKNSFVSVLHQSTCISPIVLVSELNTEAVIEAFRQGICDYIKIPLVIADAKNVVTRAIKNSAEHIERELSNRKLLMDEAVHITLTTLSHYLNNYLTALDGDMRLLQESLQNNDPVKDQLDIWKKSMRDAICIKKVIEVLVNTTSIKLTEYDESATMIDINAPLLQELNRILNAGTADIKDV